MEIISVWTKQWIAIHPPAQLTQLTGQIEVQGQEKRASAEGRFFLASP